MGISDKSYDMLESLFQHNAIKTVVELGSQQFYHYHPGMNVGDYMDKYYTSKGVSHYECIDINGCNNALVLNLREQIDLHRQYDLVTDFGTSEHITSTFNSNDLYNCWTTKYNLSNRFILSCNPSTGNWPGHGIYYYTPEFYDELSKLTNMTIRKLQYQYPMRNYDTGREVVCILEKTKDSKWVTLSEFNSAFAFIKAS